MMILNKKKVKLADEDTTTRGHPNSTSGIYLTTVKVIQFRQLANNRREKEEAKKVTSKQIATRKVHLQLKRSEAFNRCINSINSMSLSTTDEERLMQLIQKLSNTIKDAFEKIGGNFSEMPNHRSDTVAREMIRIMK